MKPYLVAFGKWYEEYFGNSQGEDSPYNYKDVQEAFKAGVKSTEKKV